MKVEKKPNIKLRAAVILNGRVALIWVVYSALDFVYDTSSTLLRVLRVFCAVFWCVIFGVSLYRYWKDKRGEGEGQ